ncbi:OmpA family protein [Castellaniella caeni]
MRHQGPVELQPAREFVQRLHTLEAELQQARRAQRRQSRQHEDGGRWGLEQPPVTQHEEGWFLTYLDMMTLLLVAMIVMLAFAGTAKLRQTDDQPTASTHASTRVVAGRAAAAAHAAALPGGPAIVIPAPESEAPYPANPWGEFHEAGAVSPALSLLAGTFPPLDTPSSSQAAPVLAAVPVAQAPLDAPGATPAAASGAAVIPDAAAAAPTGSVAEATAAASGAPRASAQAAPPSSAAPVPQANGQAPAANAGAAPPVANAATTGTEPVVHQPGAGNAAPVAAKAATAVAANGAGAPSPAAASPAAPAPATPAAATSATPTPPAQEDNDGATLAAALPLGELGKDVEVVINKRSVSLRVNNDILFDTGLAELSPHGLDVLGKMAEALNKKGYDITVEGHTDSVPVRPGAKYASNWDLSSARAISVVRYLQARGIGKAHLKAVGLADTKPIASNSSPEGRARNRRVELVIEKPKTNP